MLYLGKVLHVGFSFVGDVNLLTVTYAASFPSFNQALAGFDGKDRLFDRTGPEYVDSSFTDLEFAISPGQTLTTKTDRIVNQGYMYKGSLVLLSIGFDASFHIEISKEQIMAKGDIKNAIVFPKNGTPLFTLCQDGNKYLGPHLEFTIKEAYFICQIFSHVSFLGLSFGTSHELSSCGLKFHSLRSINLPGVVKSAVDFYTVVDKTHLQFQLSCDLEVSIPLQVLACPDVKVVTFAAVFGASVDWSKPSFDFWVTGSVGLLGLLRVEVETIAIRGDLSGFIELAAELATKIAKYLPDMVGGKLKQSLEKAIKFLKDLGLEAVKAGEFIIQRFKEGVRAVIIQLQAVYELARDAIREIARSLSG